MARVAPRQPRCCGPAHGRPKLHRRWHPFCVRSSELALLRLHGGRLGRWDTEEVGVELVQPVQEGAMVDGHPRRIFDRAGW